MTDAEIKAARAVIANVMLQDGPNVIGSAAWFRAKATLLAQTLEVALIEIERLRPVCEAARSVVSSPAEYETLVQRVGYLRKVVATATAEVIILGGGLGGSV